MVTRQRLTWHMQENEGIRNFTHKLLCMGISFNHLSRHVGAVAVY